MPEVIHVTLYRKDLAKLFGLMVLANLVAYKLILKVDNTPDEESADVSTSE